MLRDHRTQKIRFKNQRSYTNIQESSSLSSHKMISKRRFNMKTENTYQAERSNMVHNQMNLYKRISTNNNQEFFKEDIEVCKAFRCHGRTVIKKHQLLFSLRFLGFRLSNQNQVHFFDNIWKNYTPLINLPQFKQIYGMVKLEGMICSHSQIFNLMSKGKSILDKSSLTQIMEGTNWKGDAGKMLQVCGKSNMIDFDQFDHIYKVINAFSD